MRNTHIAHLLFGGFLASAKATEYERCGIFTTPGNRILLSVFILFNIPFLKVGIKKHDNIKNCRAKIFSLGIA